MSVSQYKIKFRLITIICIVIYTSFAFAKDYSKFTIKNVDGNVVENNYQINANIEYQFNDEIQKALEHGITLQLDVKLEVFRQRDWLWDERIKNNLISYRLEYHPLSNHYQVTNLQTFHQRHFRNIRGALIHLGELKQVPLINMDKLLTNYNYLARIQARLNIQELPVPLRPKAYFSPAWRLSSQYYEWPLEL